MGEYASVSIISIKNFTTFLFIILLFYCFLYYTMDGDVFGFSDTDSGSESMDRSLSGNDDLASLPSNATHQSNTYTAITSKIDDKTTIPDSVTEGEESRQDFNRNRVLRELYIQILNCNYIESRPRICLLWNKFGRSVYFHQGSHQSKLNLYYLFSEFIVDSVSVCKEKENQIPASTKRGNCCRWYGQVVCIWSGEKRYCFFFSLILAKEIMRSDDSMISPDALRLAALEWKQENSTLFPLFPVFYKQS